MPFTDVSILLQSCCSLLSDSFLYLECLFLRLLLFWIKSEPELGVA